MREALSPVTRVLVREKSRGQTQGGGREDRAETEPRTQEPRELEEAGGSPLSTFEGTALPTLGAQPSGLHNCKGTEVSF